MMKFCDTKILHKIIAGNCRKKDEKQDPFIKWLGKFQQGNPAHSQCS